MSEVPLQRVAVCNLHWVRVLKGFWQSLELSRLKILQLSEEHVDEPRNKQEDLCRHSRKNSRFTGSFFSTPREALFFRLQGSLANENTHPPRALH